MKVIVWEITDGKLQQVWQDELFRVLQNLLHMQRLPLDETDKIHRGQSMENICFDKSYNVISFTSRLRTQPRQMSLFVGHWQLWQSKSKQDEAENTKILSKLPRKRMKSHFRSFLCTTNYQLNNISRLEWITSLKKNQLMIKHNKPFNIPEDR